MKHVIPRIPFAASVLAALVVAAAPAAAQETSTADREGQRIVSEIEAKQADVERYEDDGKDAYRAQAEVYEAVNTGDASTEEMNAAEAALEEAGSQTREAQDELIELEDDLDDEGTAEQRAEYFSDAAADAERMADRCSLLSGDEGCEALAAAYGYASDQQSFRSAFSARAEDLSSRADAAAAEIAPETTAAAPPASAPPPEDAGAADGVDYADPPADPAPQQPPQQPSPYVQPEEGGGGGFNPLTFGILLAVLAGVGAVFGPRLLQRAKGLPGGDKVAAAAARVREPVQASADEDPNKPDPNGPAPRMGPWRPEPPTPTPSVPDEPLGPPKGRIVRVPPKDPSPAPGPVGPHRDDAPPTVPPTVPPQRPGGSQPRSPAAPPARPARKPGPTAPRNGRPSPRTAPPSTPPQAAPPPPAAKKPVASDGMTDEEMAYFFPSGAPAKAMTRADREKADEARKAAEKQKLLNLEDVLSGRVIGQEHAVKAMARSMRVQRGGGFGGDRPESFLFCGSTGVGKTQAAKELAEALFGGEEAMVRLDMSEYQDKTSATRITGAAPSYVGHDEGVQLVEAMKEDPRRVVLFDEIEKAHPDILTYLLQILDDGRLTSSKGETLDFKQAVVILTSNLGAEEIRESYDDEQGDGEGMPKREIMALLREKGMKPELVARIGEVVSFRPLDPAAVVKIARLLLRNTSEKMRDKNGVELAFTPRAEAWVAGKGYEPENGARPLRGAIREHVEGMLSMALLRDEIASGDTVTVDVAESGETLTLLTQEARTS